MVTACPSCNGGVVETYPDQGDGPPDGVADCDVCHGRGVVRVELPDLDLAIEAVEALRGAGLSVDEAIEQIGGMAS